MGRDRHFNIQQPTLNIQFRMLSISGIEVLHAKAVGWQVVLEFLNVLLDAGTLVIVAPEFGSVTLAISHKDAERGSLLLAAALEDRAVQIQAEALRGNGP